MTPILAAFLLTSAAPPDLAALARFPTLPQAHQQLGALIRIRHQLHQSPASAERDQALAQNARSWPRGRHSSRLTAGLLRKAAATTRGRAGWRCSGCGRC